MLDVFSLAQSVAVTSGLGQGGEDRKGERKYVIGKWHHRRAVLVLWVFKTDSFSEGTLL